MPEDRILASSAGDLLNMLRPDDDRTGAIRFPYAAGLFARGAVLDAVAYGRALGLDVQIYKGSGWLVQRGYLVAKGPGSLLYRFVHRLVTTVEWSDQ